MWVVGICWLEIQSTTNNNNDMGRGTGLIMGNAKKELAI